ncbi:MAG: hypothetical protein HYV62_06765, partial [Candidatus Rokubacteria bacterium]|nr:hypothetical protein [Candidatus Rokubacteria bacterium]
MALSRWLRTHRALAAFAAGVLLTLVALAAVGYFVLADQRRAARVLGLALSRALAREVRIDRVTALGTDRVVMRGVRLPRAAGWPAEVTVAEIEATGPLLAVARGDRAPLRLVVTRPRLDLPEGGAVAGLGLLEGLRDALVGTLAAPLVLDVALTGGVARRAGGDLGFDLVLRKARGEGRVELTLRDGRGAPLLVTANAWLDGETGRLALAGRGGLGALEAWLGDGRAPGGPDGALDVRLDAELPRAEPARVRGSLAVGDLFGAEGEARYGDGVLHVALSRVTADLAAVAGLAGFGWRPTGRAELADVALTWRRDGGALPRAGAAVRVAALGLPAAAVGADVAAERVEGRIELEPAASGALVRGALRAARVRVGTLEITPGEARYRVSLDARGGLARAELEELAARVEGAALRGTVAYDGGAGRVEARLGGDEVEAAGLVRWLLPGWLGPVDRLRLTGARLVTSGLDARTLRAGRVALEARAFLYRRPDGDLAADQTALRADLGAGGITLAFDAEALAADLPAFRGVVPRFGSALELSRRGDGSLEPARGGLTARDRAGRELLEVRLGSGSAPGRLQLAARLPDLARLDGWWPRIPRELTGSAALDVELREPGFGSADGRLALQILSAELAGGKVSLRDLVAELPVRRGAEVVGDPPWGKVEVAELIAYGVVARDVTTPARVWNDRLALNDLAYALHSGGGKGWAELELEAAGPFLRGSLSGTRVRIEEFISAYGIRGGTMTGLLNYNLDFQYRGGRLGVNGRFEVPKGGTVNIEILNRLLAYAESDLTGILRETLQNLRAFEYKSAEA